EREGVVGRHRAAEAHAAVEGELRAALEQQPDHLEEILVPAHRDAVLGHSAESSHDPIIERFVYLLNIANCTERRALATCVNARQRGGQRLDLETVDADDQMTVVHEMMRERKTRWPHTYDQHTFTAARLGIRALQVERIPACE